MEIDPRLNEIIDCLYRVAVKAVIIKDEKVLLVMDVDDEGWSFPGGGVDHGEQLHQALKRELAEEIGVDNSFIKANDKIQGIIIGHSKDGFPRCNIHFAVTLNSDNIKPNQEIGSMEWISLSELKNQTFDPSAGPKDKAIALINRLANQTS